MSKVPPAITSTVASGPSVASCNLLEFPCFSCFQKQEAKPLPNLPTHQASHHLLHQFPL